MRFIKPRKPRGYKIDGHRSRDMCSGCLSFGCDPMADSKKWNNKKMKRKSLGVCLSCGQNPCKCKSQLGINKPIIVIGKKKMKG